MYTDKIIKDFSCVFYVVLLLCLLIGCTPPPTLEDVTREYSDLVNELAELCEGQTEECKKRIRETLQ